MKEKLFKNGIFHSMKEEGDTFSFMTVRGKKISGTYNVRPEGSFEEIDLGGRHVYPCLIDGHVHMLFTIGVMAMGFDICSVTKDGIKPDNLKDIEGKIRSYCKDKHKDAVIAAHNYISSAIDEKRLPTREELDLWSENRAVIVYTIDGHSTSASSKMLLKLGICPENHSGILTGEENERNQGKLTDIISSSIGLKALSKGIAEFHNTCASYGIGMVGALEGNGDSKGDVSTSLILFLARRFDLPIRFYLQYTDLNRVKRFEKYLKHKRLGGCGDWEMDGSAGSHSAAFSLAYKDSGEIKPCYYDEEAVRGMVKRANSEGYQVASHAIGDKAIDMIMSVMNENKSGIINRIEHIEFISPDAIEKLNGEKYAVFMQPGYGWIDKRYLNTYSMYLPDEITDNMKLKSIADKGVLICLSTDSPVQSMDPYLQMLGMTQYYNESESMSIYDALKAYTVNPAAAMYESDERGTLEMGKAADFFISSEDLLSLSGQEIASYRPECTYYGGIKYKEKSGSIFELLKMILKHPKKV